MITYTTDPEGTGYAVSYLLPIQITHTNNDNIHNRS